MPAKCHICGLETKIEQAFYTVPDSDRKTPRKRCPVCWTKRRTAEGKRSFFRYLILLVLGFGFLLTGASSSFGLFVLNLLLMCVFIVLATIPHEFGHALVAKALGLRVFQVVVGYGRILFQRSIAGFDFQIKTFPFGGYAVALHNGAEWYRLKEILLIVGGPLANLLLAGLGWLWLPPDRSPTLDMVGALMPAQMFILANLICVAYSVWPHRFHSEFGKIANDGLLLWTTLRLSQTQIEERLPWLYLYEGGESWKAGQYQAAQVWFEKGLDRNPDLPALLNAAAANLIDLKRFAESREMFSRISRLEGLDATFRCILFNNIAFVNLLIGSADLLVEADNLSREAFEALPWLTYVQGTRGCILVELGRIEEGLALIQDAVDRSEEPRDKAFGACYIAIAEKRRGNLVLSRTYFEAARALDPDCLLLERAADPPAASP